jgi:hypothetical protein
MAMPAWASDYRTLIRLWLAGNRQIVFVSLAVALLTVVYLWFGGSVQVIATITAMLLGVLGFRNSIAVRKDSNAIKRAEVIGRIYNAFIEDGAYEFYDKIRSRERIEWGEWEPGQPTDEKVRANEKLLNKALTMFDEINYLNSQGLLDERAWEYIAGEIQYFAGNDSVRAYIDRRIQADINRGFPKAIIAFTGFRDLLNSVPEKFRAKEYQDTVAKYK